MPDEEGDDDADLAVNSGPLLLNQTTGQWHPRKRRRTDFSLCDRSHHRHDVCATLCQTCKVRFSGGGLAPPVEDQREVVLEMVDRWAEIKSIFLAALERGPEVRNDFLDGACLGDAILRREVEQLL